MRKYAADDERKIRAERHVRNWTRSGLLHESQQARILPELKVDLRRTNLFLRLILFGFGLLIILAAVVLVAASAHLNDDAEVAVLCTVWALGCIALAETCAGPGRFYRFGIEEACASATVLLLMVAAGFAANGPTAAFAGAAAALGIYLRFGYVYAAIASMACLAAIPFVADWTGILGEPRVLASGTLAGIFILVWFLKARADDDFRNEDCGIIQAVAWAGTYALLNLRIPLLQDLLSFRLRRAPADISTLDTGLFYWFTFAAIWILPAIGLYLALKRRDSALLTINILLALVTLATNKPYLRFERNTWDPMLLGILLIALAVILRRWLSSGPNGERHGFTAQRILVTDKQFLTAVATASTALPAAFPAPAQSSTEGFHGGGGRSGGAGATGEF